MLTPTSTQNPEEFGAPATTAQPQMMTAQDMTSGGMIASNMEPTPQMQPTAPSAGLVPTRTIQQPAALTNSFGGITNGTAAAPARENAPVATVQSQLQELLSSNSPYLQAARTKAAQVANSRGLINSSIAAGAGELAAIESSLPIAQADAQFKNQSEMLNRELASNEFRQTQQIEANERLQNQEFGLRQILLDKQLASDKLLTEYRAGVEKDLIGFRAEIEDQQKLLDITRGRNASLQQYTLQMGNGFLTYVESIWANPEIPFADKQNLINLAKTEYNNMLDLANDLQAIPLLGSTTTTGA